MHRDLELDTPPDIDIDAALARTYSRHGELVAAGRRRQRALLGGGLALIVAAGITVAVSLGDDTPRPLAVAGSGASITAADVPTTAMTTTTAPRGDVPTGYTLSIATNGTRTLSVGAAVTPPAGGAMSTTTSSSGASVDVGGAAAETRATPVTGFAPVPGSPTAIRVTFACSHAADDVISTVLFTQDPATDTVTVDARITSAHPDATCPDGQAGPSIVLPTAAPVDATTKVVAAAIPF